MVEIFNDKELLCEDCKKKFVFEAGEQKFFAIKGFKQPKRCQPCRFNKRSTDDKRSETRVYNKGDKEMLS